MEITKKRRNRGSFINMSKLGGKIKNRFSRLLASIALTYLLLMLFIFGMGILSYAKAEEMMGRQIEQYNYQLLLQMQRSADETLSRVRQQITILSMDTTVNRFAYTRQYLSTSQSILDSLDVINRLNSARDVLQEAADIFIYYNNSDIILNTSTYYTSEDYLSVKLPEFDISSDEWRKALNTYHFGKYFLSREINGDILLLQTILSFGRSELKATIGVRIKASALNKGFETFQSLGQFPGQTEAENAVYAAMMTEEGEIVLQNFSFPYESEMEEIRRELYISQTTGEYTSLNGENVLIASAHSKEPEFYYLVIAPSALILRDLHSLKNYLAILTAAGLILGAAVFIYAKKRNYNPIRQLFLLLKSKNIDPTEDSDEIRLIEKTVQRIAKESEDMKNAVSQQYPIIRNNLLIRLMSGTQDAGEVCSKLETLDIVFAEPNFVSLLLEMEQDDEKEEKFQNQQERLLVYAAVTNISQDLFRMVGTVYSSESPDGLLYLLVNTGVAALDAIELIDKTASELISLMNHLFGIQLTIGMSTCRQGTEQISRTGQEARKALKNRFVQGSNTVCAYESSAISFGGYYYPLELEQKLINYVSVGDQEQSEQILQTIYQINFKSAQQPPQFSNCLLFDILSTVVKIMADLDISPSEIFPEGYSVEKEMLKCSTVTGMFDVLNQAIAKVCAAAKANKRSSNTRLMENIQIFIDENYSKDNICITLIADAVKITPTYLSHLFKENTGVSVMKYIEQRRMDKVKQLLCDTSLTVNEIASQTGFTNSAVLIRTFKKINGITPGQYRQTIRAGQK